MVSVRFEDLRADPVGNVARICRWLGAHVTNEEVGRAVERCALDRMRDATRGATPPGIRPSPTLPPLVNDGRVGGWRDVLTERQIQRFGVFADGLQLMGYPTS